MEEKLREYIENIFSTVPCTVKAVELKEEVLQNLLDKYHDMIAEGKSEQAAYNISIASIGDINELLSSVKSARDTQENDAFNEKIAAGKRRNALLTAIAVIIYILCPVPCILLGDGLLGPVLLFVMVAIATGIIIYKSMTKPVYAKKDDTIVEDFKQWNQEKSNNKSLFKAISSAVWSLIVVAYFIVSFTTGAWHITWVIFLLGGAVEGIIKAIIDLAN